MALTTVIIKVTWGHFVCTVGISQTTTFKQLLINQIRLL